MIGSSIQGTSLSNVGFMCYLKAIASATYLIPSTIPSNIMINGSTSGLVAFPSGMNYFQSDFWSGDYCPGIYFVKNVGLGVGLQLGF